MKKKLCEQNKHKKIRPKYGKLYTLYTHTHTHTRIDGQICKYTYTDTKVSGKKLEVG